MNKIGLGGGCHWCTEAVFQSLNGVCRVEQGFVASIGLNDIFSEAVIVHFDPKKIGLRDLLEIHLHTHSSSADHSMRSKYRSAVYTFSTEQSESAKQMLRQLQAEFKNELITRVYPFNSFKPSEKQFHDYYFKNPDKPFCENYIRPKLILLLEKFSENVNQKKLKSDKEKII